MNVLPRETQVAIVAALLSGHGQRATARRLGLEKNTVDRYSKLLRAGKIPDIAEAAAPLVKVTPSANGKRGRILRTDAGREVTHEEVLRGVTKWTATEIAATGRPSKIVCSDCPAVVKVSALGPIPTRCKRCTRRAHDSEPATKARNQAKWKRIREARKSLEAPTVEALTEAARLLTPDQRKALVVAILTL